MGRMGSRHGQVICGVDEAGRGPWAGPVVAAAVILCRDDPIDGLDDSKKLTAAAREQLFDEIVRRAAVATALVGPRRIDAMNIRAASLHAMALAIDGLPTTPTVALIDGNAIPPGLGPKGRALVRGDARSVSIAAASIVAKVVRDRLMIRLAEACPGYGFEAHKGYGTAQHRKALLELGPTIHHRRSFAPVRDCFARAAA
ncbi:MAG: ribonuclease HII [Pseudomonadota bacterium]